ncbi:DUF1080 domain-containing protein, partial [bacterium]|nr:DUF1080 domain-containing protein [bacterium]
IIKNHEGLDKFYNLDEFYSPYAGQVHIKFFENDVLSHENTRFIAPDPVSTFGGAYYADNKGTYSATITELHNGLWHLHKAPFLYKSHQIKEKNPMYTAVEYIMEDNMGHSIKYDLTVYKDKKFFDLKVTSNSNFNDLTGLGMAHPVLASWDPTWTTQNALGEESLWEYNDNADIIVGFVTLTQESTGLISGINVVDIIANDMTSIAANREFAMLRIVIDNNDGAAGEPVKREYEIATNPLTIESTIPIVEEAALNITMQVPSDYDGSILDASYIPSVDKGELPILHLSFDNNPIGEDGEYPEKQGNLVYDSGKFSDGIIVENLNLIVNSSFQTDETFWTDTTNSTFSNFSNFHDPNHLARIFKGNLPSGDVAVQNIPINSMGPKTYTYSQYAKITDYLAGSYVPCKIKINYNDGTSIEDNATEVNRSTTGWERFTHKITTDAKLIDSIDVYSRVQQSTKENSILDYYNDFSDTGTAVDFVRYGTSKWSITHDVMKETLLNKIGFNMMGKNQYDDFIMDCELTTGDEDPVGFAFRFTDVDNYYRVEMANQTLIPGGYGSYTGIRLYRRKGGVETLLKSNTAFAFQLDQSSLFKITCYGNKIEVRVNGQLLISYYDSADPLTTGFIGFYTRRHEFMEYDNFSIYKFLPQSQNPTLTIEVDAFQLEESSVANTYLYDGQDSLIYTSSNNFNSPTGTITFWFKPLWNGTDTKTHGFFAYGDDTNTYMNLKFDGADQHIKVSINAWTDVGIDASTIVRGQWYKLSIIWNSVSTSQVIKYYLNDELKLNITSPANVSIPAGYSKIGIGHEKTEDFGNACVVFDDFKIYNYECNEDEISDQYNSSAPFSYKHQSTIGKEFFFATTDFGKHAGLEHRKPKIDVVSYFDNTTVQFFKLSTTFQDPSDKVVKMTTVSDGSQQDSFAYRIFNSTFSHTILPDDKLVYKVYFSSSNPSFSGGLDADLSISGTVRDNSGWFGIANGLPIHPSYDLSQYSKGKWFTREFEMESKAGEVISNFKIVNISKANSGTYVTLLDNVWIVNDVNGTKIKIYTNDDSIDDLAAPEGQSSDITLLPLETSVSPPELVEVPYPGCEIMNLVADTQTFAFTSEGNEVIRVESNNPVSLYMFHDSSAQNEVTTISSITIPDMEYEKRPECIIWMLNDITPANTEVVYHLYYDTNSSLNYPKEEPYYPEFPHFMLINNRGNQTHYLIQEKLGIEVTAWQNTLTGKQWYKNNQFGPAREVRNGDSGGEFITDTTAPHNNFSGFYGQYSLLHIYNETGTDTDNLIITLGGGTGWGPGGFADGLYLDLLEYPPASSGTSITLSDDAGEFDLGVEPEGKWSWAYEWVDGGILQIGSPWSHITSNPVKIYENLIFLSGTGEFITIDKGINFDIINNKNPALITIETDTEQNVEFITYEDIPLFFTGYEMLSNHETDMTILYGESYDPYEHEAPNSPKLSWTIYGVDTSLYTAFIDPATDFFEFDPLPGKSGQDLFNLRLRDHHGRTDYEYDIPFIVIPVNDPPYINPPVPDQIVDEGIEGLYDLTPHAHDEEDAPENLADKKISIWTLASVSEYTDGLLNVSDQVYPVNQPASGYSAGPPPVLYWSSSDTLMIDGNGSSDYCSDSIKTFVDQGKKIITNSNNFDTIYQTSPDPFTSKVVYWDANYPRAWMTAANGLAISTYFSSKGFLVMNANDLKTFMENNGDKTVVVMAHDVVPDTIADSTSQTVLIRQYMNRGGRVVWTHDWPMYYQGHSDGTRTTWGATGCDKILGIYIGSTTGENVSPNANGLSWGLSSTYSSVRAVRSTTITQIFSQRSNGDASAWFKNYNNAIPLSGFVRWWDQGGSTDTPAQLEELYNLAINHKYSYSSYNFTTFFFERGDGFVFDPMSNALAADWKAFSESEKKERAMNLKDTLDYAAVDKSKITWWNDLWNYKVRLTFNTANYTRNDYPAEVDVNFTTLFSQLGLDSAVFDRDSIRVIESSKEGYTIKEAEYQFTEAFGFDTSTYAAGKLYVYAEGKTNFDQVRYFDIYFDTDVNGPKEPPAYSSILLFYDNFSDGNTTGWNKLDLGNNSGPSNWYVNTTTKQLVDTTNIHYSPHDSPEFKGTSFLAGDTEWGNYTFSINLMSPDNDLFGMVFRYQDQDNYYRFIMNNDWYNDKSKTLDRRVAGVSSQMSIVSGGYQSGKWENLSVIAYNDDIYCYFNNTLVTHKTDPNLKTGKIGLTKWAQDPSYFDNIKVLKGSKYPLDIEATMSMSVPTSKENTKKITNASLQWSIANGDGSWWNTDWHYRVDVEINAGDHSRTYEPVNLQIALDDKLEDLNETYTGIDPNSIRILEMDAVGNIIREVPSQAMFPVAIIKIGSGVNGLHGAWGYFPPDDIADALRAEGINPTFLTPAQFSQCYKNVGIVIISLGEAFPRIVEDGSNFEETLQKFHIEENGVIFTMGKYPFYYYSDWDSTLYTWKYTNGPFSAGARQFHGVNYWPGGDTAGNELQFDSGMFSGKAPLNLGSDLTISRPLVGTNLGLLTATEEFIKAVDIQITTDSHAPVSMIDHKQGSPYGLSIIGHYEDKAWSSPLISSGLRNEMLAETLKYIMERCLIKEKIEVNWVIDNVSAGATKKYQLYFDTVDNVSLSSLKPEAEYANNMTIAQGVISNTYGYIIDTGKISFELVPDKSGGPRAMFHNFINNEQGINIAHPTYACGQTPRGIGESGLGYEGYDSANWEILYKRLGSIKSSFRFKAIGTLNADIEKTVTAYSGAPYFIEKIDITMKKDFSDMAIFFCNYHPIVFDSQAPSSSARHYMWSNVGDFEHVLVEKGFDVPFLTAPHGATYQSTAFQRSNPGIGPRSIGDQIEFELWNVFDKRNGIDKDTFAESWSEQIRNDPTITSSHAIKYSPGSGTFSNGLLSVWIDAATNVMHMWADPKYDPQKLGADVAVLLRLEDSDEQYTTQWITIEVNAPPDIHPPIPIDADFNAPWWNKDWAYRTKYDVGNGGITRNDFVTEKKVNFTDFLTNLGDSGKTIDINSIRVIEYLSAESSVPDPIEVYITDAPDQNNGKSASGAYAIEEGIRQAAADLGVAVNFTYGDHYMTNWDAGKFHIMGITAVGVQETNASAYSYKSAEWTASGTELANNGSSSGRIDFNIDFGANSDYVIGLTGCDLSTYDGNYSFKATVYIGGVNKGQLYFDDKLNIYDSGELPIDNLSGVQTVRFDITCAETNTRPKIKNMFFYKKSSIETANLPDWIGSGGIAFAINSAFGENDSDLRTAFGCYFDSPKSTSAIHIISVDTESDLTGSISDSFAISPEEDRMIIDTGSNPLVGIIATDTNFSTPYWTEAMHGVGHTFAIAASLDGCDATEYEQNEKFITNAVMKSFSSKVIEVPSEFIPDNNYDPIFSASGTLKWFVGDNDSGPNAWRYFHVYYDITENGTKLAPVYPTVWGKLWVAYADWGDHGGNDNVINNTIFDPSHDYFKEKTHLEIWPPSLEKGTRVFYDDFNDGNYSGWSSVDLGGGNAPIWSITSSSLRERSNAANALLVCDTGFPAMTSYYVKLKTKYTDYYDNAATLVFGYKDKNNYYRFQWEPGYLNNTQSLVEYKNGVKTTLLSRTASMVRNTWYDIEVFVFRNNISIYQNNTLIMTTTLTDDLPLNKFGVWTWDNDNGVYWDDVEVFEVGTGAQGFTDVDTDDLEDFSLIYFCTNSEDAGGTNYLEGNFGNPTAVQSYVENGGTIIADAGSAGAGNLLWDAFGFVANWNKFEDSPMTILSETQALNAIFDITDSLYHYNQPDSEGVFGSSNRGLDTGSLEGFVPILTGPKNRLDSYTMVQGSLGQGRILAMSGNWGQAMQDNLSSKPHELFMNMAYLSNTGVSPAKVNIGYSEKMGGNYIIVPEDTSLVYDLTPHEHDDRDESQSLTWTLEDVNPLLFSAYIDIESDDMTLITEENLNGMDQVLFTLFDSRGLYDTQEVFVVIAPVNDAPEIMPAIPTDNWWDIEWAYRAPITVTNNNHYRIDYVVTTEINFTNLLNSISETGDFDINSIRVTKCDVDGNPIPFGVVPSFFEKDIAFDKTNNAYGKISWVMKGEVLENTVEYFQIYFDIVRATAKPAPDYPKARIVVKPETKTENFTTQSTTDRLLSMQNTKTKFFISYPTNPTSNLLEDQFNYQNFANWSYSEQATVPFAMGSENVCKNEGTNQNYLAEMYRAQYNLQEGDIIEFDFMINSNNHSYGHFYLETPSPYARFCFRVARHIQVQIRDGSYSYPKILIDPFIPDIWYHATFQLRPEGLYMKVHQKDNPAISGEFSHKFIKAQNWRFRHSIYRHTSYIDNYTEIYGSGIAEKNVGTPMRMWTLDASSQDYRVDSSILDNTYFQVYSGSWQDLKVTQTSQILPKTDSIQVFSSTESKNDSYTYIDWASNNHAHGLGIGHDGKLYRTSHINYPELIGLDLGSLS